MQGNDGVKRCGQDRTIAATKTNIVSLAIVRTIPTLGTPSLNDVLVLLALVVTEQLY